MSVGGVTVRASLTHRVSCKSGLHHKGQNKNRVSPEVSRLSTDSRVALLGDSPCRGVRLGRCGQVTWKQGHQCEKVRTTDRHKHLSMWPLSTHSYLKNSGWERKAVIPRTPSKQDDLRTKR